MANTENSVSSDISSPSAGQPPIVLARLPRVGAEAPASPVHFQPVPPPEAMPRLDLHTEIDRRSRLHIADTPANDSRAKTSHFADGGHAVLQTSPPAPSQQPATRQSAVGKPMTLSEKLFYLHTQLSPHAGLIVALALIASAGLLYWMIVGPGQVPMPNHENYGTEFSDEGFGSISNYTPEFVAEASQPTAPQSLDDQWNELLRMEVSQVEQVPSQLAQPEVQPEAQPDASSTSLREISTTNELLFPKTDYPELDFSKLQLFRMEEPQVKQVPCQLAQPEAQPEAQPDNSSTNLREISTTVEPLFPQTDYRELVFSKLQPMPTSQPTPNLPQSLPEVAGRSSTTTTR